MFYRARQKLNRSWFDLNLRAVLQTSALQPPDAEVTVASMLCHRDLIVYLLAYKSFVSHLGFVPHAVVLNDGSLSDEDRAILACHIPGLRVVDITTISNKYCPTGGCWERLLLLTDLIKEGYTIQLDSDTLTLGDIIEVLGCVREDRNFELLGDRSYPQVESMLDACKRAQKNTDPHVQAFLERSFDTLPEAHELKYLRGNAGFVGFKKNAFNREQVEWFSRVFGALAGERWKQWGSEQVTTNLLIANSTNPLPLSPKKYLSYWAHPGIAYNQASFLHFIGPRRWHAGMYRRSAIKVLATL